MATEKAVQCDLLGVNIPLRRKPEPMEFDRLEREGKMGPNGEYNEADVNMFTETNTAAMTMHSWADILGLPPKPMKREYDIDLSPEARQFLKDFIAWLKVDVRRVSTIKALMGKGQN